MRGERSIRLRRTVLFGVPLLYLVLGLFHPAENPEVGDATGLFIGLHFAQLFLIGGLAYALWLLVDGIDGRAARVARALILPYAIAYTALDAILGLAWGIAARKATELAVTDQPAAGRLIDELLREDALGYALYWGAGLLWLAAALAAVATIRRSAPWPALVLMALGALVFTAGHAQPIGPIGMGLFLAGVAWLELRPRSVEARRGALGLTT
jgi:hypothetical protein